jgi:hypothetical protein
MLTRILALKRGEVQVERKLAKRGTSELVLFSADDDYNKQETKSLSPSLTPTSKSSF